jgi:hypothetical protein
LRCRRRCRYVGGAGDHKDTRREMAQRTLRVGILPGAPERPNGGETCHELGEWPYMSYGDFGGGQHWWKQAQLIDVSPAIRPRRGIPPPPSPDPPWTGGAQLRLGSVRRARQRRADHHKAFTMAKRQRCRKIASSYRIRYSAWVKIEATVSSHV